MPKNTLPKPVIIVPGVTATELQDFYDFPPTKIWSAVMHKDFDRVALHAEDSRYEARLPAQVRPDQIFAIAYREMVEDLRHNLTPEPERPVPVYVFGYDWRQPLSCTQDELAAFIDEVISKTCLTRHYFKDGYRDDAKVSLVGHSMGGMIITGYLATRPDEGKAKVERVATICTPYKGSLEAVEKLIKGTRNQREREAARLTPGLYHLLPTFKEGITIDPALGPDLYDARVWQAGLSETIKTELLHRGSGAVEASLANAQGILQGLLDDARSHRDLLDNFKPADVGLGREDWLAAIGVGEKTRTRLTVADTPIGPSFDLSDAMVFGGKGRKDPLNANTGDGTVPHRGALPAFAADVTVEYFTRDDFGLLELVAKGLNLVTTLHGIIPNMDKLQNRLRNFLAYTVPIAD